MYGGLLRRNSLWQSFVGRVGRTTPFCFTYWNIHMVETSNYLPEVTLFAFPCGVESVRLACVQHLVTVEGAPRLLML